MSRRYRLDYYYYYCRNLISDTCQLYVYINFFLSLCQLSTYQHDRTSPTSFVFLLHPFLLFISTQNQWKIETYHWTFERNRPPSWMLWISPSTGLERVTKKLANSYLPLPWELNLSSNLFVVFLSRCKKRFVDVVKRSLDKSSAT